MAVTKEEVTTLKQRWTKALGRIELWRSVLDAAYHFTRPNHNMWSDNETEGTDRGKTVYDLTPMKGLSVFAARLHNILTPSFFQWASMVPGHEIERLKEEFPDEVKQFDESLQNDTNIIFDNISASNFDLEIHQCYFDLGVGTGALLLREGDDEEPLEFHCVSARELAFEENARGVITNVWRFIKNIKRAHVEKIWPKADLSKLPTKSALDPELEELTLVESVVEKDKNKFQLLLIDEATNTVLFEQELKSSPWIIFRWSRFPDSILGIGPVLQALSSILTINKMVEFELIGNAFRATPAWTGFSDDVFNPWTTRITPNTIIPINASSADTPPLRPLEVAGDVRFTQLQLQELRQQINDVMLANPLGQPLGPVKTATEFLMRRQQLDEETAIAVGRLMNELIRPLLKRVRFILEEKGILERSPEINGKTVAIKYQTPLANAQNVGNAEQFLTFFQSLAGVVGQQRALLAVNPDQVPGFLAEQFSIDEKLIKSIEQMELQQAQIQQIATNLLQQQQQQQQGQQGPVG